MGEAVKNCCLTPIFSLAALSLPSFAVDATYNNLEVNGQADFAGANTTFGTSGTASAGVVLNYIDGSTGTITLIATPSSAAWQWAVTSGTSAVLSMRLDGNNQLSLYTTGTGNSAGIVLNPTTSGTSTVAGCVAIGGTNNVLPNQVLVSGSSILTQNLADGRYAMLGTTATFGVIVVSSGTVSNGGYAAIGASTIASGSNAVAIGYSGTASGFESAVFGAKSVASGSYASAVGYQAKASGYQSYAGGVFTQATEKFSTAVGNNAMASGTSSCAFGYDATAESGWSTALGTGADAGGFASSAIGYAAWAPGNYSFALGYSGAAAGDYSVVLAPYSEADGDFSVAAGQGTVAYGYQQFVIGQWNLWGGNPNNWVATDNLFIVGNGVDGDHPSNAFVVMKNGDTLVNGAFTISGTTGNLNTITNGGLVVTGTTVPVVLDSGTVDTVVATGTNNLLLVPQQGDLSMGEFVEGAKPPSH